MRLAALSDVHGNVPALEAVLFVIGNDVDLRRTEYDLERAAAAIRASGHPMAEELAAENVLAIPSRQEALTAFGG